MDACLTFLLTIRDEVDVGFSSMRRVLCLGCDGMPNTSVVSLSSNVFLLFRFRCIIDFFVSFLLPSFCVPLLSACSPFHPLQNFRISYLTCPSAFFFDFSVKTFKACFRCWRLAFSATWIATCLITFLLTVFCGLIDSLRKNSLLLSFRSFKVKKDKKFQFKNSMIQRIISN